MYKFVADRRQFRLTFGPARATCRVVGDMSRRLQSATKWCKYSITKVAHNIFNAQLIVKIIFCLAPTERKSKFYLHLFIS